MSRLSVFLTDYSSNAISNIVDDVIRLSKSAELKHRYYYLL